MGKVCIKCGYERQQSEAVPDYECPKCGVIYAKAEAAALIANTLPPRPSPKPKYVESTIEKAEKPMVAEPTNTKLIDVIERRYLFSLTRGLALVFIALLMVAIVGGIVSVGQQFKGESTKVSPKEVVDAMREKGANASGAADSGSPKTVISDKFDILSAKLPERLKELFVGDENIQVLENWLTPLTRGMRKEFIDEMDAAVAEAQRNNLSATEAINRFKHIKLRKLSDAKVEADARNQTSLYYVAAAFSAVLLVALLSLILVLLAIERNTRGGVLFGAAK